MNSAVRMRQNHYETLGLKPTASDQEIGEGFARVMGSPHLIADVAQIGVAFDTLGNPAKRRAYDEALGLVPKPQPRVAPSAISFRISGHFVGVAPASQAQPEPTVAPPLGEQLIERRPQPDAPLEESVGEREAVLPELPIPEFFPARWNGNASAPLVKQQVTGWKCPGFALGSLILGVVLIGTWAGAHAEDAPKSPEPALTVALPPAKASSGTLEVPPPSTVAAAEPEYISPAVIEHARQRMRARAAAHRRAGSGRPLESPADGAATSTGDQPPALEAKLPLPNNVIARTIERIGYSCGGVASATAIEGDQSGAYKVTCTSGQSYQARPVNGRYHFKRW